MSPAEVVSRSEHGPYKTFKNGDVETYNYKVNGQPTNIQFYFGPNGLKGDGLNRISIGFYEGDDVKEAAKAWRLAYEFLRDKFGPVELPDIHVRADGAAVDASVANSPEVLSIAAAANADVTGKTQMAPTKQPNDKFVFSSFTARVFQGKKVYGVVVYYDRI